MAIEVISKQPYKASMLVTDMITEVPLGEAVITADSEGMEFDNFSWYNHRGVMRYVVKSDRHLWIEGRGRQPIKVSKDDQFPIVLIDEDLNSTSLVNYLGEGNLRMPNPHVVGGAALVSYHISKQALLSRKLHQYYWGHVGSKEQISKIKGHWCEGEEAAQVQIEKGVYKTFPLLYCAGEEIYGIEKDKAYLLVDRWEESPL